MFQNTIKISLKYTAILFFMLLFSSINIAQAGSVTLDTEFNSVGYATANFYNTGTNTIEKLDTDSSGNIYVAASIAKGMQVYLGVLKYTSAGALDTSFNETGYNYTTVSMMPTDIKLDSSGNIYVVGYYFDDDSTSSYSAKGIVVKILSTGVLDTSFGTDGVLEIDYSSFVALFGLDFDSAQNIILSGGTATDFMDSSTVDSFLSKIDSSGNIDEGFGSSGYVVYDFGGSTEDYNYDIVIDSSGNIVAGGHLDNGSDNDLYIARFTSLGALDTTFNSGTGYFTDDISSGYDEEIREIALATSGNILFCGRTESGGNYDSLIGSIDVTTGQLDTAFNSGTGYVQEDLGSGNNDEANSITVDGVGKIIVAGYLSDGTYNDTYVMKFNSDGSDASFPTLARNYVTYDPSSGSNDELNDVVVLSDGTVIGGGESYNSNEDFFLISYTPKGLLNTSFDSSTGHLTEDYGYSTEESYDIAQDTEGNVILAGYVEYENIYYHVVTKYDSDGNLDTNFDSDGYVIHNFGGTEDRARAVLVDSSNNIILGGHTDVSGTDDFLIAKYDESDGNLDTSFGRSSGYTALNFGSGDDKIYDMIFDSSGNIITVGLAYMSTTGDDFALAKLDSAGLLVATFGTNGITTLDISGSSDEIHKVFEDDDGNLIVAGEASVSGTREFAVAKFDSGGVLDTSYGTSGYETAGYGSENITVVDAAMDDSSNVYMVAYYSDATAMQMYPVLTKFTSEGVLDTSFGTDGFVVVMHSSTMFWPGTIMVDDDNKIVLVGGMGTTVDFDLVVAKFNSDGSFDTDFDDDGYVTDDTLSAVDVYYSAILDDNTIIATGNADYDFLVTKFTFSDSPASSSGSGGEEEEDSGSDDDTDSTTGATVATTSTGSDTDTAGTVTVDEENPIEIIEDPADPLGGADEAEGEGEGGSSGCSLNQAGASDSNSLGLMLLLLVGLIVMRRGLASGV